MKAKVIRQWANDHNEQIGLRGRLPKALIVDYLMEHPAEARAFLVESGIPVGVRGRIARAKVEKAVNA